MTGSAIFDKAVTELAAAKAALAKALAEAERARIEAEAEIARLTGKLERQAAMLDKLAYVNEELERQQRELRPRAGASSACGCAWRSGPASRDDLGLRHAMAVSAAAHPAPPADPAGRQTLAADQHRDAVADQGRFIEETILSVLHQDYPAVGHIVMDGGSADETPEILARYRDRLAFAVSEKDKGQSEAINKGFARATGEILTWLNADEMVARGRWRPWPSPSPAAGRIWWRGSASSMTKAGCCIAI